MIPINNVKKKLNYIFVNNDIIRLILISYWNIIPKKKILREWIDIKKINWSYLSGNENAIDILKENKLEINWDFLSKNPNAIDILKENKDKIIDAFNKEEVKEKQRRIKLSLLVDEKIEESLGFTINIPSAYRISKATDDFFWVRKNISNSKTMEFMFYEIPLETISKGDSTIVDIVKMRDRVSKTKIPGEDNIYMKVEEAYAPSMFNTIIDNKPTYEVRSVWTMNEYPMAGPFITYLIEDKINNRYLVADGYVYAPSLSKRDLVFELESIIKSIKIK